MKKGQIALLLTLFCFTQKGFGSPAIPDYIIHQSDTIRFEYFILGIYFRKLDSAGIAIPQFSEGMTLNCWRGYQAIYQVERDSFFLVDIINCKAFNDRKIDKASSRQKMKIIFGEKVKNGKVFVDWFSGVVSFSLNNICLRPNDIGPSSYEKEHVLKIVKGHVLESKDILNYEEVEGGVNRKNRSDARDVIYEHLINAKLRARRSCSGVYHLYVSKEGWIKYIERSPKLDEDGRIKAGDPEGRCDPLIRDMFRVLRSMRFDILKERGEPVGERITLDVDVSRWRGLTRWSDDW